MSLVSNGGLCDTYYFLRLTNTWGRLGSKSGVVKDERDTATRRVRHRDGKLLRGGLGLTTGLGWSDRSVFFFFFLVIYPFSLG